MGFLLCTFIGYTQFMLVYNYWLYSVNCCFYKPLTYKKNGKDVDVHSMYEPFRVRDSISFIRLFIGSFFLFPIRICVMVYIAINLNKQLK